MIDEMMGMIMMARMIPAASMPISVRRAFEEASPAQGLRQERLDVSAQERHQDEHRPEPVNHAGNGSQQFDEEREWPAQCLGAHLGREDGNANRQRNRDDQRQQRRNQRPVNERKSAELLAYRIPVAAAKNLEAKRMPGES